MIKGLRRSSHGALNSEAKTRIGEIRITIRRWRSMRSPFDGLLDGLQLSSQPDNWRTIGHLDCVERLYLTIQPGRDANQRASIFSRASRAMACILPAGRFRKSDC